LPDGSLLLGVHSKPLELVAHASDPAQRSTSHIMHLTPDGKGGFTPETLYLNFGQELSGASVGASANKRLLIGSIFEPKILNCSWEQGP
jgi:arylesterase/paraoxonase